MKKKVDEGTGNIYDQIEGIQLKFYSLDCLISKWEQLICNHVDILVKYKLGSCQYRIWD